MPNGHGGKREPAKPAPASGPGRYSKRTDGGPAQKMREMTGGSYGDSTAMADLQRSAPMGATPDSGAGSPATPISGQGLQPLDAPTSMPGVGLMDNVSPRPAQMAPSAIDDASRERMKASLPVLLWLASQPNASEQTRQYVRKLRSEL